MKPGLDRKYASAVRAVFWLLYGVFIFLWFKDNLHPLKSLKLSPSLPLFGILFLTLLRLYLGLRAKRIKIRFPVNKVGVAVFVLLVVALGFRIPFLLNGFGLLNSDEAVPALMGKHIAEGGVPPVYYYGQLYMGSVAEHFFACLFLLFGYSVYLYKFATLLFFLAFVLLQFLFLKRIFPFPFAFSVSLLSCLPWGNMLNVSLDDTGVFSLVLLLGTSQLYISYLICWRQRQDLIPALGFLMGLAFWAHQISVCYILTALLLIVWKVRWKVKKYLTLMMFAGIGCLPVLMLEAYYGFRLFRFLLPEGGEFLLAGKVGRLVHQSRALISLDPHPASYVFLGLVLVGCVSLTYLSFRGKSITPEGIFCLFFLVFCFMYLFSGFSTRDAVRYLYPLFTCLPVLLLSGFLLIRTKIKYAFIAGILLLLFFPFNGKGYAAAYLSVKTFHHTMKRVITTMEQTGKRNWRGEYWAAYLITALSGESLLVDSSTINRYYPYRLKYDNDNDTGNFVFRLSTANQETRARKFVDSLAALQLDFKQQQLKDWLLVYDVEGNASPDKFMEYAPSPIPEPELTEVSSSQGNLLLKFKGLSGPDAHAYWVHAEIPGYSSYRRNLSPEKGPVEIRLPYPQHESVTIRYHLEYKGSKIPSTSRELTYFPIDTERRKRILILSGLGPMVRTFGKPHRVCSRELSFELNRIRRFPLKVRLYLYSPFEFSHPYWYGNYFQSLKIHADQRPIKEVKLQDGENIVEFELHESDIDRNHTRISLEFKYHSRYDFFLVWRIAALWEKIEVEWDGPDT
jgi:hypothetical protein